MSDAIVVGYQVVALNAGGQSHFGWMQADVPFFMVRLFQGAGSPSATTLPNPPANQFIVNPQFIAASATGNPPDLYIDTNANALWMCTVSGNNSSSQWKQISGGGTLSVFQFVSDQGDFIECVPVGGGASVNVAKLPHLMAGSNAITSEVSLGITYTYTYARNAFGTTFYYQRTTSGSDGSSTIDVVTPQWVPNQLILALPVDLNMTFTDASSNPASVSLMEVSPRYWTALNIVS